MTRSPLSSIAPVVGASSPDMHFSSVVLPAPEGPTMHTNSPFPTSKLTSAIASVAESPVLRRISEPIVEFLRAIPAPALLPFALLVLGVGNDSKIFVIAFVCLWPILLNAVDGVSGVDPTLVDTGRVYRIPASDRLRHVVLPAATPQIFAGMRTSLSLALILMVISEMVASSNGIGYFVLQSQRSFAIPEMWSGIILLGLLGYAFNAVFLLIERRVLAWHRGARAASE